MSVINRLKAVDEILQQATNTASQYGKLLTNSALSEEQKMELIVEMQYTKNCIDELELSTMASVIIQDSKVINEGFTTTVDQTNNQLNGFKQLLDSISKQISSNNTTKMKRSVNDIKINGLTDQTDLQLGVNVKPR